MVSLSLQSHFAPQITRMALRILTCGTAEYKEWFFVNIYTKKSQWDKPTEPVYPPGENPDGPSDAPPSYNHDEAKPVAAEKTGLSTNNPYAMHGAVGASSAQDITEDEKLARKLQEEENAKLGNRGESDAYYGAGPGAAGPPGYGPQPGQYGGPSSSYDQALPPRPEEKGKSKGLFGKLLGKSSHKPTYAAYPQQQQQYYPPQQPPYGYPQQGYYQQGPPGRRPGGGGLGVGTGAALGVGAGLLGGALIADAATDGFGGDDGGDYGGGDDGGGGDFGGGDFGGGDF
jgi:hypothetical protein